MIKSRFVLLLGILVCQTFTPPPCQAHPFWIVPTQYQPDKDEWIGLQAMIGHPDQAEPFPYQSNHIDRFIMVTGEVDQAIWGRENRFPTGHCQITGPGTTIIGYQSHPQLSKLDSVAFDQHLKESGLQTIRMQRRMSKDSASTVREGFVRCAKLILAPLSFPQLQPRLDFELELVILSHSPDEGAGHAVAIQALRHGSPVPGLLIQAESLRNEAGRFAKRSQSEGIALIKGMTDGPWLFHTVHMEPGNAKEKEDWRSYWSTLVLNFQPMANHEDSTSR